VLTVFFFLVAAIKEHQTIHEQPEGRLIENFRRAVIAQRSKLTVYLNEAEQKLDDPLATGSLVSRFSYLNDLYDKGFGFAILEGPQLLFWSSNQFAFAADLYKLNPEGHLLFLPNGIYLAETRQVGPYELVGLLHLKNNFSYENQYLKNSFVAPFKLPSGFRIWATPGPGTHEIYDQKHDYLFSVQPSGNQLPGKTQLYSTAFFFLLGFVFLLVSIYHWIRQNQNENFVTRMFFLLVFLSAVYWLHIIFNIPEILNHFTIFTAQYFAQSNWLPSLGDFYLITAMIFFWSLIFVREFPSAQKLIRKNLIPAFAFAAFLYLLAAHLITSLIINSNVSFNLFRIIDINSFSIASYLAIAMILFSVFLIHLKVIGNTGPLIRQKFFLKTHLILVPAAIFLSSIFPSNSLYMLTLFLAVNLLHHLIRETHISRFSLSYSILFISLFTVASLMVVYSTIRKRDLQIQKVYAINLSSEQDPVAEVNLTRIEKQIRTDSVISKLLFPPYSDLENYLTRSYFSGYFRKYDIQFTICSGSDSLLLKPENNHVPCFPFFEYLIRQSGIKIQGCNYFYFMNHMNGRVSYLGEIHYPMIGTPGGISIYMEIDSKIISEGIGFPELLMDQSVIKPQRYKYLSYAKYYDDELVDRGGEYTYNYYLQAYNLKPGGPEFQLIRRDGYDHLIYSSADKTHIIVSNKALRFADYLISFPYLFVFYFLFVLVLALIGNPGYRKLIIPRDLRFRIQFAIISVVLVSLLFVATGTIYYNIQEYRERHQNDLREKMKSISEEIKSRLLYVDFITPELQEWLYGELYKLSNTFRTDINIYDLKGNLLATSRPEIFARGVVAPRMNADALYQLSEKYQLNYFHPENNGSLSYLSSYEPVLNARGNYLGYLNLPYFARQDELRQGISTFIVAFINLYLFLFLASVIVAVFLSNRITQPLALIREKLRSIQLGKKSEQINYQGEDEIGALVREYNHKVEELAESADRLARSERESAWREMAKQVAHEIKNPLTPMKLNIQYLQRAKAEGAEHYDDFFNRVTKNLIEQIDTLSGIATEFSNFAQIPSVKNEIFDLAEVLQNTCALFESNQNLQITFEKSEPGKVEVFADKEQLSRAFLNLVKNGIQSVPADRIGKLTVTLSLENSEALVAVQDNGTGISADAREHLFQPNFTTKTSGMGLGLSIVHNIIQTAGGKIWYETYENAGTTFYVKIPVSDRGKSHPE
jgi:signal transduction histidine kinase